MATGRPLSQVEIETQIAHLMELLEHATEEYDDRRRAAAESEVNYRIKYAQEMVTLASSQTLPTVALREARALLNSKSELTERMMDEAMADSAKAAMTSIRDRLSAGQTLLRSIARQT